LTGVYDWSDDDRALSARMSAYLVNFARTGNPNGIGLPAWPDFETRQRIVLSPAGGTQSLAATALLASLQRNRAAVPAATSTASG
jgi:carboxylesterase type B